MALLCALAVRAGAQTEVRADALPPEAPGRVLLGDAVSATGKSDRVTVNAQNASMTQVLSAFSLQTGRSVVIGPEVGGNVNLRLQDVPWEEALDVILKPYGYGYRRVGDTIVVNNLSKMQEVETVEPLESRVFSLRYLDAADVRDIVQSQLSPRGQVTVLTMRGQRGWEFATGTAGRSSRRTGAEVDKRARVQEGQDQQFKSKTIIVMDVPSVIERVQKIIDQVDKRPAQVLIEARFVEVDQNAMRDLGLDFGTGASGATTPGVQPVTVAQGGDIRGYGVQSQAGAVSPAAFVARSANVADTPPFNAGLSVLYQQLTGQQFEVLLHVLQEDAKANILSSPRILTLNNQEATIIVGTKFPIISSDTSGINATTSTSLEYYENIGIQLNVVPQVCDGGYVNMIVHPAVTDQIGTAAARTQTDQSIPLTEYPVLSTREAETQILLQSGQTVVIGGLLEERGRDTVLKVPLLGDIPLIGNLFKRTTKSESKFDLLIFLTATIIQDPVLARADLQRPPAGPEIGESFVKPFEASRYDSRQDLDQKIEDKRAKSRQAEEVRRAEQEEADAKEAALRKAAEAESARLASAEKAAAKKSRAEKAQADKAAAEEASRQAELARKAEKADRDAARVARAAAEKKAEQDAAATPVPLQAEEEARPAPVRVEAVASAQRASTPAPVDGTVIDSDSIPGTPRPFIVPATTIESP